VPAVEKNRNAERTGDLLGLKAARTQADDFGLAWRQTGRELDPGGCPDASTTAMTASGSSRPARASPMSSSAARSGSSAGRWGRTSVIA
jgi:hypothetical protein